MSTTNQRRILIIGADGLRPDLFDRTTMPNLAVLEAVGTRFADHHAVYPSHTRVNMSTLTTGTTPGRHGIVANTMQVAGATEDHIIDTSNYQHLDALDWFSDGKALFAPTLGDRLADLGERVAVAGTGSSGSNVLWTRNDRSRIINTNSAYGIADLYDLREKLGEIPEIGWPQTERLCYATRAVTDVFLDDPRNRVIVLWLSEPDASLHRFGLGSPETVAAMRGVDECIGAIMTALERAGTQDQFDIIFLSDHGHSTVQSHDTLREYVAQAFAKLKTHTPALTTASDYVYASPGTPEPDVEQLAPLVEWLYAQPWCDIVFSGLDDHEKLPGALPLAPLWNGAMNPRRPLLAVSPRWNHDVNEFGVPGTVSALTTQSALKSSHGSVSPYDMHAMMIASGPSFQEGLVSDLPTGATDLAPTILTLLGMPVSDPVDGRILWEGLVRPTGEPPEVSQEVIERAAPGRETNPPRLCLHRAGHTTYVHGSILHQPEAAS